MNNVKEKAIMFGKAQCSAWVASAVDFGITLILTSFCGRVVWLLYLHRCGVRRTHQLRHQLPLGIPHVRHEEEVCGAAIHLRMGGQHRAQHRRHMAADGAERSKLHDIENHCGSIRGCVLELSSTTHIRVPRQPQQPAGISRRLLAVSYGSPSVSYACSCVGIS